MGRSSPSLATSGGWLGGRNSWRRIVLTGVAAGLALAFLAALTSSFCTGGSGSLNGGAPTAIAPAPGVIPIDTEPPIEDFVPAPTVVIEPTEEPMATEPPPEPSPTQPEPTEVLPSPTVAEITPEATP